VVLHASIYVLCIANMSPPDREFADSLDRLYASGGGSSATVFAGRPFHFNYESIPLKLVMLVDVPAAIGAGASGYAVQSALWFEPRLYVQSWLDACGLLVVASMQWLLMGYWFERRLEGRHRWARVLAAIRARRAAIGAAVVAATIVAAPLIQMRSNSLQRGHAAISFWPAR
jgi:hypothetical protein